MANSLAVRQTLYWKLFIRDNQPYLTRKTVLRTENKHDCPVKHKLQYSIVYISLMLTNVQCIAAVQYKLQWGCPMYSSLNQ